MSKNSFQPLNAYHLLAFFVVICVFTTTTNAQQEDLPIFSVKHHAIHCIEYNSVLNVPFPNVHSPNGKIVAITYDDELYQLGCNTEGFTGYFDIKNWNPTKINGDGGVDVTGALNVVLVEGANTVSIEVTPGSKIALQLIFPANGSVTFDWGTSEGSTISMLAQANSENLLTDRYFSSPNLNTGDTLDIVFENNGTIDDAIVLKNFQFFSAASSVIARKWLAIDEAGKQEESIQWIAIEGIRNEQILMPEDAKISTSNPKKASPESFGYPIFDRDGNPETFDDQIILDHPECGLNVKWKDEITTNNGIKTLTRSWKIEEDCGNIRLFHVQKIELLQASDSVEPENRFSNNLKKKTDKKNYQFVKTQQLDFR